MTRWQPLSVPLDGAAWTALTDRRLTLLTPGEAPAGAPHCLLLVERLSAALAIENDESRTALVDFAVPGRCSRCAGRREIASLCEDGFTACRCVDDAIIANFYGAPFDLRLVAAAIARLPPGDVCMGLSHGDSLIVRTERAVAIVMGLRLAGWTSSRVWGAP